MARALVTGATGLVGRHAAERLVRDGWSVSALVRDPKGAVSLESSGIELFAGDVLDEGSFTSAARGCDLIVHAAAAVTASGGWEAYRRPNIDGTLAAIAATEASGARLVHVSSVAVYGAGARYNQSRATDEDTPFAVLGTHSHYARSKRESEALVMQAHEAGRIWATAVRPDVVYGRFDRQFVPRIGRLLSHGVMPLIGRGDTTLAVVHAGNVADGIVRAARADVAGGRAYNLANDFDVTVAEFFRLAAIGMGRRLRMPSIPHGVAKVALGAFGLVAPLVFGSRFNAVTSASLDFLTKDNPFSSDRARRELGWDPPVPPSEGVVDAFRWWAGQQK